MIEILKNFHWVGLLAGLLVRVWDEPRTVARPSNRLRSRAVAWARPVARIASAQWCRKFHRKYHQTVEVDCMRTNVKCNCCGRKVVRISHQPLLPR